MKIINKLLGLVGFTPNEEYNKVAEALSKSIALKAGEVLLTGLRRSGNSTRLADSYIQKLFTDGVIKVEDHYPTPEASASLFETIVNRLKMEHPSIVGKLKINKYDLTIGIN